MLQRVYISVYPEAVQNKRTVTASSENAHKCLNTLFIGFEHRNGQMMKVLHQHRNFRDSSDWKADDLNDFQM